MIDTKETLTVSTTEIEDIVQTVSADQAAPKVLPIVPGEQRQVDAYLARDGYTLITVGDVRYHWCYTGSGANRALAEGYKPRRLLLEIVPDLAQSVAAVRFGEDGEPEMSQAEQSAFLRSLPIDRLVECASVLFFAGAVRFYPTLTMDDAFDLVDYTVATSMRSIILEMFAKLLRQMVPAVVEEAKTLTNGTGKN